MQDFCGLYSIIYSGENLGEAVVARDRLRWHIAARISACNIPGPFRLAAVCGNKTAALGVMLPQNGGFTYSALFTASALREKGICSGISYFTLLPCMNAETGNSGICWEKSERPELYIEEGEFRRIFSACRSALIKKENGEQVLLAVPVKKGEKFPLMSVFCLGTISKINGQLHLVFKINDGRLVF